MIRLLFVVFTTLLLGTSLGEAQSSANALLERAAQLRNAGKPDQALVLLEGGGPSLASPRYEAELALTHLALDRPSEALPRLRKVLAMPSDPWLDAHRAALRVALQIAETRLARIEVTVNAIGAEVLVNGLLVGRTPLPGPIEVAEGKATILVKAEGFVSTTEEVAIRGGGLQTVEVTLEPMPCDVAGMERTDTGGCCWPGQRFEPEARTCTGKPQCAEGFVPNGEACVAANGENAPKDGQVPADPTKLTGFRMGLRGHSVRYFSGTSDRFGVEALNDGASKGHGFGGQLELGYRVHRFASINFITSFSVFDVGTRIREIYQGAPTPMIVDVEPRTFTYDAGFMARLHTNSRRGLGAVDFQIGLGFVPLSIAEFHVVRTGPDGRTHDRSVVRAFRYPAQIALAIFTDHRLSIDFFGEISLLTARSFCGPGGANCRGKPSLSNEGTWSLGAGLSFLH